MKDKNVAVLAAGTASLMAHALMKDDSNEAVHVNHAPRYELDLAIMGYVIVDLHDVDPTDKANELPTIFKERQEAAIKAHLEKHGAMPLRMLVRTNVHEDYDAWIKEAYESAKRQVWQEKARLERKAQRERTEAAEADKRELLLRTKATPPIQKGLKKFTFDGVEIHAINLKNAERKFHKLNRS